MNHKHGKNVTVTVCPADAVWMRLGLKEQCVENIRIFYQKIRNSVFS